MLSFLQLSAGVRLLVVIGLFMTGWSVPASAVAQDASGAIPWKGPQIYELLAENQNVKDILRSMTGAYGITAVIDEEISTPPISAKYKLPPQALLNLLVNTYGLIWFYDGNLLYIERASAAQSEVVKVSYASDRAVRGALRQLGLDNPKPPLNISVNKGFVRVGGPKAFVRTVREAIRAVDTPSGVARNSEVRTYKLRYASAVDISLGSTGGSVVIPGVARVLQSLISGDATAASESSMQAESEESTMVPLRSYQPKGLPFASPVQTENPVQATIRVQQEYADRAAKIQGARQGGGGGSGAQIVAEARNNVVIVRDSPERFPMYDELIQLLDVKPVALEIEASIIEIASDAVDALGVSWRFGNRRIGLESGNELSPVGSARSDLISGRSLRQAAAAPIAEFGGGVASAIINSASSYLFARIDALTEQGKANIVSKPRVVTLDNLTSLIRYNSTFYVPVSGAYDAKLFDITVGLSLKVTPRLINDGDGQQIQLMVQIEDGSITDAKVGQVPIITRASLNTQSYVREGESLVLAGFTQERVTNQRSGVPGLSALPVVGQIFRTDRQTRTRSERLFVLTPRLLRAGAPAGTQPVQP